MKNREIAAAFMASHGQSADCIDIASSLVKLQAEIDSGLEGRGGLPMLPAYIQPETLSQRPPDCISIDIGGSTLRRAVVHWKKGKPFLSGIQECALSRFGFYMDEECFFQNIVDFSGIRETGLPMAVSYSYNMESIPGPDARMLGWCKELTISNMTGMTVAQAIRRAAGVEKLPVSVINDSVAAMLGCEKSANIGIIVGTGFNICSTFPVADIKKLEMQSGGSMIVNTEVGESRAFETGDFEAEIIAKTEDPSAAQAEKQVSGRYLEQIIHHALKRAQAENLLDKSFCWELPLPQLGKLIADPKEEAPSLASCIIAQAVERSATIAAICLHAFLHRTESSVVTIAAEGSVIRKMPMYAEIVARELAVLSRDKKLEFTQADYAGIRGAARTVSGIYG